MTRLVRGSWQPLPLPGSCRCHPELEGAGYLEGLQEGIEVDEDDAGHLILTGVHKEEHVGDAQQREQHQRGLHSLPAVGSGEGSVTARLAAGEGARGPGGASHLY